MREGLRFVGVEREAEYVAVARARIERELEASALLWGGNTLSP